MPTTFDDVCAAAVRLRDRVHHTPVLTSPLLDEWLGFHAFLKAEHLQRSGSFKLRGATNAVMTIGDDLATRGVAAHSSGNHAAALALAARDRGIVAHVVMPADAPAAKRAAVDGYGARVVECEPTIAARENALRRVLEETGAVEVHPYDDDRVIAGAGTAALELLEAVPGLDVVIVPVGGGGLLAGTSIAAHGFDPAVRVIAGEPAGADDAARLLAVGRLIPSTAPDTIADGLLTSLSPRTFDVIRKHVERIVPVGDAETISAMRVLWERMKQVIEPSSAVAVAGARLAGLDGLRVGIVLSGGNCDPRQVPWALDHPRRAAPDLS
ncbi:MAG: pyridoxal-phosphate dependent enzyme [Acidimicrobiia bacterium]|nr:pyridoxal-phosphate dependent enzyme [Acidimicrobiia bacterium]